MIIFKPDDTFTVITLDTSYFPVISSNITLLKCIGINYGSNAIISFLFTDGTIYDIVSTEIKSFYTYYEPFINTIGGFYIYKICTIPSFDKTDFMCYGREADGDNIIVYSNNTLFRCEGVFNNPITNYTQTMPTGYTFLGYISDYGHIFMNIASGVIGRYSYYSDGTYTQEQDVFPFPSDIKTILFPPTNTYLIKYMATDNTINYLRNVDNVNWDKLAQFTDILMCALGYSTVQVGFIQNIQYNHMFDISTFSYLANANNPPTIYTIAGFIQSSITFNIYDTAFRLFDTDGVNLYIENGTSILQYDIITKATAPSIDFPSGFTLVSSINTGNMIWLLGTNELASIDFSFIIPITFSTPGAVAMMGCYTGSKIIIVGTDGSFWVIDGI
jgi:hypothetical protein